MKKDKITKAVVVVLIAVVILGMWVMKNMTDEPLIEDPSLEFQLEISEFDLDELKSHEMPIIIDFGSDSCVPCKQMYPALEVINKEMQGKAIVQFIDVWKYPQAAADFPFQVIPTQFIWNADGSPYVPSEEVSVQFEFEFHKDPDTDEHIYTSHTGGLAESQMRVILRDMGVE